MTHVPPGRLLARLAALGHLDPEWAADREVSMVDASRSNPVHMVLLQGAPFLVVKQSGPSLDAIDSVESETAALAWVERHLPRRALAPRLLSSAGEELLVVEALRGSRPLHEVVGGDGPRAHDAVMDLVGRLAALHRASPEDAPVRPIPWALRLNDGPPDALASAAGIPEVVDAVRGCPALMDAARELRARWRPERMIHGDLKFDNVLVTRFGDASRCWLIDWELAGGGLPEWDLAGVLEGLLAFELEQEATASDLSRALAELTTAPMLGYRAAAGASAPSARATLQALAVRLAQTAVQIVAMRAGGLTTRAARAVPRLLRTADLLAERARDWADLVWQRRAA